VRRQRRAVPAARPAAAGHAAIYDVVDARAGFVSQLITSLADALALPAPARDTFLFAPDDAFYAACTESIVTLQHAARKIIDHLGLRAGTVVVGFVSGLGVAGRIERQGGAWFIEIDARYRGDGPTLGAILAHECCHIVLHDRGVRALGNALDEVHVDLAAMLTGLGALTLNAIHDRQERTGNELRFEHRSFGYLRAPRLEHAYADVCARLGVPIGRAARPLRSAIVRRGVITSMLRARVPPRRPLLGYAPAGDHLIVACPRIACTARLRVPAGRRGTARCPRCEAKRDVDGRALATRALAAPIEPMFTSSTIVTAMAPNRRLRALTSAATTVTTTASCKVSVRSP
jgi:hypothetical protein